MDRDSDMIANSSLIPCLLCHQKLAAQTDEHEKHLKIEHKVKFQLSWILKKTWKDWLNNLNIAQKEIERKLVENDSIEGIKIKPENLEENDQPYFSPSKLLVEMRADDDPKNFTDLDQFYSANELVDQNEDVTNHNENEQTFEMKLNKPYKCSFCEKSFKTKSYVEVHEKKHSNEIIPSDKQKTVAENVTIPYIINVAENVTIPYKCSFCEKSFKTKANVEVHIKKHSGEIIPSDKQKTVAEEITIPDVLAAFDQSNDERKYKKKKHNIAGKSDKPYECSICEKAFKIKNYVKIHEKKEHNYKREALKTYQCSVCIKAFNTKYYVKIHEKKEHNYKRESLKPYPCSFCEKSFKTKYYVDIHKKTHSAELGESQSNMCSYDGCGKECLTSDDLQIHLKTHKKQKYKCSICAKGFKTKDYFLAHEKKSHNYQCSICEKGFTNETFARVHEKKKHSHVKVETDE